METITNALFSRLKTPVPELYSRHITLLAGEKGEILDLHAMDANASYMIAAQLQGTGNIRPLFNIGPRDSLAALADKGTPVYGYTARFKISETVDHFYTSLPVLHLRLERVSPRRFLGIISISHVLPNLFEKTSGVLLYIDPEERLVGFNQVFHGLFKAAWKNPGDILGRPAGHFLSPTPSQLQAQLLGKLKAPDPAGFQTVYSWKGEGPDSGPWELAPEGLRWTNPGGGEAYLTSPAEIPCAAGGLTVEVEFKAAGRGFPCIVLGDRAATAGIKDGQGYFLGPGSGGKGMVFKKHGFPLLLAPVAGGFSGRGWKRLRLARSGNAFFASLDGREFLRYYDPDPVARATLFCSLMLRAGHGCVVKRFSIQSGPGAPVERPTLLTRAKDAANSAFLISRFDSYFLASHGGALSGYRLQDVSALQNNIQTLESREKALSGLVARLRHDEENPMVGSGKSITALREQAERLAASSATILIEGPTGAGKEVLARHIHRRSAFSKGAFVKVDCAVVPPSLMESELFGHEKGAFTGAAEAKAGLFEQAAGGTLFLDEIHNLSLELQAKLLHFTQDFTLRRVGGSRTIKIGLRLIGAANAGLRGLVDKGLFREDLYYRLAVAKLTLPPLSERKEDLQELCLFFLERMNRLHGKSVKRLSPAAFRKLLSHDWPGNIRELKNALELAVVLCNGEEIQEKDLSQLPAAGAAAPASRKPKRAVNFSRAELTAAFEECGGTITTLAQQLNVTPRALYYHFRKIGWAPDDFRKNPFRRGAGATRKRGTAVMEN